MATIYGPQKGHATLYDTSGDDTIVAAGGYNTIYSLFGNDTISGGSIGYNTILAGTQYDYAQRDVSIRVNGLGNTIDGGDSNFTISSWTGDATINLGDGNDNLTLGGFNNTVTIGLGADNIIAGSGDDSVTVVGSQGRLNGPAPETIAVHFSGDGNSFSNSTSDGSAEAYPLPVVSTITGGSGDGNFTLWGGGSVVTWGLNNNIVVGDGNYNVVAGSGDDSVYMDSPFGGMDVNVTLAGSGNRVSSGGGGPLVANISGGTGDTTVNMGNSLGEDQGYITPGGSHNTITAQGMSGLIDSGGDGAIINLSELSNLYVTVHGAGDFIGLGDLTTVMINDQSNGLQIDVSGRTSAEIYNFGFDRGAVLKIDLQFGYPQPFQNTTQILDALEQGPRGAVLGYGGPGGGSFSFDGVSVSQLHASNFAL
jgi:hypothetical protein